jgi:hypothetical protein
VEPHTRSGSEGLAPVHLRSISAGVLSFVSVSAIRARGVLSPDFALKEVSAHPQLKDYYAADLETLAGAPALALVKSVAEIAAEKGEQVFGPDCAVNPTTVIDLAPPKPPLGEALK